MPQMLHEAKVTDDDDGPELFGDVLVPTAYVDYQPGAGPQLLHSHEQFLARIYAQDSQIREQVGGE